MMSEVLKTMTFIGTAVVVLALAWISRPAPATFDAGDLVGETLYDFDPLEARRLKIVRFNSLTGEPREFEVAKVRDTWLIPSKDGYPADAEDQMAEAATALDGKEVLRVASENASDHRLYGVLDPTDEGRQVGDDGVGTRVTIEDAEGKKLADLIIGREDKDTPEHRYVRPAGRDIVVVAEVSPEKLSTSFDDWIEKDLLKLSPWDIQQVRIKDYSFEAVPVFAQGGIRLSAEYDHRSDMTFVYNDRDAEWTPQSLLVYDPQSQEYVEQPIAEEQELDSQKLNDLKNALDDLRIVDVGKKPEGLSTDLKASEDFLRSSNKEAIVSLMEHGFAPVSNEDGTLEIAATEGEVVVTMKTGVEYVLRFGEAQVDADSAGTGAAGELAGEASGSNLNRYLFVLARFNEDAIPKPEVEAVPPLPEGITAESAGADDAENAAATEEAADASAGGAAEVAEEEASEDEDMLGAEAGDSAEEDARDAAAAGADAEAQTETEQLLAERKRIEEENQRKLDEYAEKITKGKEAVQELNERFGDWYYVIADAEYQRIHLSRDQVVKEKEAEDATAEEAEGGAMDAAGFGRPGEALPGLPDVSGLLDQADEQAARPAADEPAADQPAERAEEAAQPTGSVGEDASAADAAADKPEIASAAPSDAAVDESGQNN